MKTDSAFIKDLSESRSRVDRFAAMCRRAGADVWVYPPDTRPDSDSRSEYSDGGDMMLQTRIEHKVRDIAFTCAEDFPYSTMIVDEVYKVDRIKARPFRYVIENKDGTRIAVVKSSTKPHWTVSRRYDPQQRRECEFYEVPTSLVTFCDFGPESLT